MPILLISALLLAGFGYWEYTRIKAGLPLLPFGESPEQVAARDTPLLSKEVLDLYYNGRNAPAMHAAAATLEKYGFFDAGMLLHKRADAIASGAPPIETPAQGSKAAADKAAAEQAAQEAAAREIARQQAIAAGLRPPIAPASGTVNLQNQTLKVYQSPSLTGFVIGEIPPHAPVVIRNTNDQFYLIEYQGLSGWVNKNYVDTGPSPLSPTGPQIANPFPPAPQRVPVVKVPFQGLSGPLGRGAR